MVYEVYIKNCSPSAFYTDFGYNWFTVLGKIVITNGSGYVDPDKSKLLCSPSYSNAEFSVEKDGSVAFQLGSPLSCEQTQYPGELGQVIPLTNGAALLFSVVVHAGPGAVITWKNPSVGPNLHVSVYGKYCPQNCAGNMNVSYDGGFSPEYTMPAGSFCNSAINFNFGGTPVNQTFPGNVFDPIPIPLYLSGLPDGTVIDEIETVLEIKTENYMEYGNTIGGLIPCQSILIPATCDIRERYYESGNYKFRELTAHSYGITYNGDGLLFSTYLLGTFNESIGDCAEVTVKYMRIKIGGACCLVQPASNQGVTICFDGYPPCPEFNLALVEEPISETNCDLDYTVKLSWSYAQPSFYFERLNFDLLFVSDIPLDPATVANTICPGDGCITVTNVNGANKWLVSCNLENNTLSKNSSFTLRFSGLQGCVKSYLFSRSELKVAGGSICVPSLSPQYTTGNYIPRCFARLAGTVTYKIPMCDEFEIRAIPATGAPDCTFSQTLVDGASNFSFCACQNGFPYKIICQKELNSNDLCGVSTFDLVLINKHVLGLAPFDETFKEVAADVNCSGTVSTFDVSELRKLILGNYTSLPNAPSFKILSGVPPQQNQTYNIPTDNPYCQAVSVKNVTNPSANLDYYVVKTGDVNYNCPPNGCVVSNNNIDEKREITLQLDRSHGKRGERVRIPVRITGEHALSALQLTLRFDPGRLSIQGMIPGELSSGISDHNLHSWLAENGELRWLWYDETGRETTFHKGQVLLYIDAFALEDLGEQDVALAPFYSEMPSLGYNGEGAEFQLKERTATAAESFVLRAVPNPFESAVSIQINMPDKGFLKTTVFDALGTPIFTETKLLEEGLQEIRLDERIFRNTGGVYFVTAQSAGTFHTLRLLKQ